MVAATQVLQTIFTLYLEGTCPHCLKAVPVVVTLPEFYPMSILLERRPDKFQCEDCGDLDAREVFGRVSFKNHAEASPYFRRAWKSTVVRSGNREVQRIDQVVGLEEAWSWEPPAKRSSHPRSF